ncbi:MAG TPA: fibronectin type III domain-containing protein, partial [Patescibacteria group bacterium]
AYSSTIDDTPNGVGSTDTTPPTISNITISNVNTTSATVTWTTDKVSDSSVGFSQDMSFLPKLGIASMGLSHSVTLTGLAPGTTYNIHLESRDISGNLASNDSNNPGINTVDPTTKYPFAFTTLPGPAISNVTIPTVSNNQATISWKTTTDSSSFVVYSDTVSGGQLINPKEFGTPGMTGGSAPYNHSVTINSYNDQPLVQGKHYYFYVKSVDSQNNIAIDNNGGIFYDLLTTEDNTPPVISSIQTPVISSSSASVVWSTDEPATSKVSYKKHSASSYADTSEVMVYDHSHYVILSTLDPDTQYDFKVTSKDINGNSTTSNSQTFTTQKDLQFQHDPLKTISNISDPPSVLTDTDAVITFNTDQGANCFIEYGPASSQYTGVPVKESKDTYNIGHSLHLMGLIFKTQYFYKLTCVDNLGTQISSDEKNFTTQEQLYTASGAGALGDHTPPIISNVQISGVTGESATVTWDTDEKSNGVVGYGIASTDENEEGDRYVNKDPANYTTSHSVDLAGLIPATKYVFVASSIDASGNIAHSAQQEFTTLSPSSLSSIKAESNSLGQATITWETSLATTSVVEYGLTTSYGEKKEDTGMIKSHSIGLANLNQGVVYHYRVKGKDGNGKLYASADNTFQPKSPPQISDIAVESVNEHGAHVIFKTDVPTDANITFTNAQDKTITGSQGKPDMATSHAIDLQGLDPGVTYSMVVTVRDEQGTENHNQGPDFTTDVDKIAPKIDQVRTDSALTQNDVVQAIISWKTDEVSDSAISYREGREGQERQLNISDNLTTSHIAVVTTFKPGMVYYFKVKSTDGSGNTATSSDFALLTPKRKENIIQVIVSNFQGIFGWMKF